MNSTCFTEAYAHLSAEETENYHRAVFANMEGGYAAQKRVEYYRGVMRQVGGNVAIGCGVRFVNPQWISLGNNVTVEDGCTLVASSEKGITLNEGVRLKHGVYLDTEGAAGYITIGRRVYIGTGCCLHGHSGLEIGDDSLLAQQITITPYSHKFDDPGKIIYAQGGHQRKVTIGRDCYLGMRVVVLWSADIGEGSVVGAGSVVVKPVPPYSVAVGVPARVVRKRGQGLPTRPA
jgi:acetyltransferase-like isoleucine patch superfamily enzyme